MLELRLIKLMSDGVLHSGDELGEALCMTRAAVWKRIESLRAMGVRVDAVKGKGYRMLEPVELLDLQKIRGLMESEMPASLIDIHLEPVLGSTNHYVLAGLARYPSGFVCLAEQQLEGRGRRGRRWVSPFARGVYLSMLWHFSCDASDLEGLSLAVGVAVAESLESLGVKGVRLKWPNDVLLAVADNSGQMLKLGGVLLEMQGDLAGPCSVVIGVGVNVGLREAECIDQPWTSVDVSRNILVAELAVRLHRTLLEFEQHGFEVFREHWVSRDAHRGKKVVVGVGANSVIGKACGVDQQGYLLLQCETGMQRISGGEVSLRAEV